MEEIWKDIIGYEGLYQVSNFGNFKTMTRVYYCGRNNNIAKIIEEGFLNQRMDKDGYLRVYLFKNGKCTTMLSHRVVAIHFLDNIKELPQINHKDENKTNNHIGNLEWCDIKYNVNYGTGIARRSATISKAIIGVNILTGEEIKFTSSVEASKVGFTNSSIRSCCRGKRKSHKGYSWRYTL